MLQGGIDDHHGLHPQGAVLLGLLLGLSKGTIALPPAIAIQSIDPVLLLILPWAANRIWPPIPIHPAPVQTAA